VDNQLTLGENTYTVGLLDPDTAHELFIDIVKMAGPGLVAAIASGDLLNTDAQKLVGDLADRLNKETVAHARNLFKTVTTVTINGGKSMPLKDIYSLHFKGKIVDLNKWFVFCCKVQFADFLRLLGTATDQDGQ
jgi:hypothetical protein